MFCQIHISFAVFDSIERLKVKVNACVVLYTFMQHHWLALRGHSGCTMSNLVVVGCTVAEIFDSQSSIFWTHLSLYFAARSTCSEVWCGGWPHFPMRHAKAFSLNVIVDVRRLRRRHEMMFGNISETTRDSKFKFYHHVALDSLCISISKDVASCFGSAANRIILLCSFGSCSAHDFSVTV